MTQPADQDVALTVVRRLYNDAPPPPLPRTLAALRGQRGVRWKPIVFESASTDGSPAIPEAFGPDRLERLAPGSYRSADVLNRGAAWADTELITYLNSDAIMLHDRVLRLLADGVLADPRCAGAFASQRPRPDAGRLRCMYVGRLCAGKGVYTACAGVDRAGEGVELDVYGEGDEAYASELRARFAGHPRIRFHGRVAGSAISEVYAAHDCVVFPREWAEPFALVPLEAAASRRLTIGTTTGGSGEFLVEGDTAPTFAAGDADGLARRLREARADPDRAGDGRARLRDRARAVLRTDHDRPHRAAAARPCPRARGAGAARVTGAGGGLPAAGAGTPRRRRDGQPSRCRSGISLSSAWRARYSFFSTFASERPSVSAIFT